MREDYKIPAMVKEYDAKGWRKFGGAEGFAHLLGGC